MTYQELVDKMSEIELEVHDGIDFITVKFGKNYIISFDRHSSYGMDTTWSALDNFTEPLKEKIYSIADAFARTPVEERELPVRMWEK